MNASALVYVAALCGFASTSLAEPCVSKTFERPLPDATNVVSHVSDVPSVLFPVFWQEGILEGFRYKILASGEGSLRPTDILQNWTISITCDASDLTCDLSTQGEPPQTAVTVSNKIGQCLLGTEIVDAETATLEITPAAPQAADPTCGSAAVNEDNDVAVLQRLLTIAGEDPGPVDGLLGPLTFAAMDPFVQGANRNTPVPDVIALLDALLCETAD